MGQALNAVIGQGSTRVTLLQMVTLYAAIANGGKLWLPQIVERIESPDQQVLEEFAPRVRRELSVSPENLALFARGWSAWSTSPRARLRAPRSASRTEVEVAGKTGTAQVRRQSHHGELSSYDQNDHAWFVGLRARGQPPDRVRGPDRARRPRRRGRGAGGDGDRAQLLRDRRARSEERAARRAAAAPLARRRGRGEQG